MIKNYFFTVFLFTVFCLNTYSNPLQNVKAENIEAVFVEEMEFEDSRVFSVSPDGKYFAVARQDSRNIIQIIEQDTMRTVLETPADINSFDYDFFRWSPDSKKAVVTEDFLRRMLDSDLWVLDLNNSEIYHLFPDDIRDTFFVDPSVEAYAEYLPVWSPDSKSLLLSRCEYNVKDNIMGIIPDYSKSAFKEIEELHHDVPYLSWTGAFWREEYIYYTWDASSSNYDTDGIYRIKPDGGSPEKIAGYDEDFRELILMDVSKDENYALAQYYVYQYMNEGWMYRKSFYRLINLSDFSVQVFKEVGDNEEPFFTKQAMFSPSGSKVLSVNMIKGRFDPVYSLMLRDTGGNEDYEIIPGNEENPLLPGTAMLRFSFPIFWTSDDYIYLIVSDGSRLLKYRLSSR
jgi:hypothetical protein